MGNSVCNCKFKQDNNNEVHMDANTPENSTIDKSRSRLNQHFENNYKYDKETILEIDSKTQLDIEERKKFYLVCTIQRCVRVFLSRIRNKRNNKDKKFNGYLAEGVIKYIGETIGQIREGFGIQTWRDGAIYVGYWKNHMACGFGKFCHSDGDVYLGEFSMDKATGYGFYAHSNGAKYDGEWLQDLQEGIGFEIWNDSSFYEGCYSNGKKHGLGKYIWGDGSGYEGYWYENSLHGYGLYKFKDGRVYHGNWKMNAMDGYGEYYWTDGRRYLGFYENDKKDGFGIYIWNDERFFIGFWKNGKQQGIGKYTGSGVTKYGEWLNGKRLKWFDDDKEAIELIEFYHQEHKQFFQWDYEDILNFAST